MKEFEGSTKIKTAREEKQPIEDLFLRRVTKEAGTSDLFCHDLCIIS